MFLRCADQTAVWTMPVQQIILFFVPNTNNTLVFITSVIVNFITTSITIWMLDFLIDFDDHHMSQITDGAHAICHTGISNQVDMTQSCQVCRVLFTMWFWAFYLKKTCTLHMKLNLYSITSFHLWVLYYFKYFNNLTYSLKLQTYSFHKDLAQIQLVISLNKI